MKKLITVFFYLCVFGLLFIIYYSGEISELLHSSKSGGEDILYLFYEKYFKAADSFNLIWFFIFTMVFLLLLTFLDVAVMRLFVKLARKSSGSRVGGFFKVLASRWARPLHIIGSACVVMLFVVLLANGIIVRYGNSRTFGLSGIPDSAVVMVPGTNKYLRSVKNAKKENVYFTYRIDAALDLWRNGKAKSFFVSGDRTGEIGYDETLDIANALIAGGVPEKKITRDTSGLRTHDSMVALRRYCSKVHTREAVLVSQAFQNRRALFMAPFFGIKAEGFSAKGSPTIAMSMREFLGKPKVLIDLFITNVQPKETQAVEIRDRFEITSGAHLRFVISMFFAYFFFIVYITKYLEKYEVVSFV